MPLVSYLYLNTDVPLSLQFTISEEYKQKYPIETGEMVRILSDGEEGFLFNLSR